MIVGLRMLWVVVIPSTLLWDSVPIGHLNRRKAVQTVSVSAQRQGTSYRVWQFSYYTWFGGFMSGDRSFLRWCIALLYVLSMHQSRLKMGLREGKYTQYFLGLVSVRNPNFVRES